MFKLSPPRFKPFTQSIHSYTSSFRHLPITRLTIPPASQEAFAQKANKQNLDPREGDVDISKYSEKMASFWELALPKTILKECERFRKKSLTGLLEVNDLPVDRKIPSGTDIQKRINEKGFLSQSAILGFAKLIGYDPLRDYHENNGKAVQDVAVLATQKDTESGRGSKKFPWHGDLVYTGKPHDMTGLITLVGSNARTGFTHVRDVIEALKKQHPHILETARKPDFLFKKEPHLSKDAERQVMSRGAVLRQDPKTGQDHIFWYSGEGKIEGLNDDARETVKVVKKLMDSIPPYTVSLDRKGKSVFWLNKQISHARLDAIREDRWLQRVYANHNAKSSSRGGR